MRRVWTWLREANGVVVTVLALVLAAVLGGLLVAVSDQATRTASGYFFARPGDTLSAGWRAASGAYRALFEGAVLNPSTLSSGTFTTIARPLSETVTLAAPLILAGLSVALAFRAGLFNIGGQGQIVLGAIFAGYVGFAWHLPVVLHLLAALVAGLVGGALWGGIAGILKARFGAHEVITTIMLNYVGVALLGLLLTTRGFQRPPRVQAISPIVDDSARLPRLLGDGLRVNAGIILAVLAAVAVWWLVDRSVFGFRLRAVGGNPAAARTAGMAVGGVTTAVMVVAGGLAGLAGAAQILGTNSALTGDIDAGIGFDGITVALLGRGRAGGTVAAGLLFGGLRAGGSFMQSATNVPLDLVTVLQALIVVFVAAPTLVAAVFRLRESRSGSAAPQLAKGWG